MWKYMKEFCFALIIVGEIEKKTSCVGYSSVSLRCKAALAPGTYTAYLGPWTNSFG